MGRDPDLTFDVSALHMNQEAVRLRLLRAVGFLRGFADGAEMFGDEKYAMLAARLRAEADYLAEPLESGIPFVRRRGHGERP